MADIYDTYAYFWVSDYDCEASYITEILALEPTEVHTVGDKLNLSGTQLRRRNMWMYMSSLPRDEPRQDEHISNLLEVLLPRRSKIDFLKSKFNVGINCVGYYTNVNSGFHLSSDLISSCAKLGISIDFDLYNYSDSSDV